MRLLIAAALAAVAFTAHAAPPPRLVVLIVIDGLPQWQVTQYREQLAPDGFRRFLDRGRWYAEAHYGHAYTVTAAGHATMLTGAPPRATGIVGNEWRDYGTGEATYNTGDASARYLGHETPRLAGTSPRNLLAESLGDVVKRRWTASKVIGISGKDRGAILPAGRDGTAYMYQADTGRFASTTHYMKEHPAWVEAFNARRPADRYFGREWKPLRPAADYGDSVPDGQPWFAPGGALPKRFGGGEAARDRDFYGSLLASPFADALALEFARAAVAGERLGRDEAPDILSVSLSGHDYVNHAYSAESRLSHDHVLQLDRLLQAFFRDLDRGVGRDRYLAVLTADHGFMPAPEWSQEQGREAGRVHPARLVALVNAELATRHGPGNWVLGYSAHGMVLDRELVARSGVELAAMAEEVRRILVKMPFVAAAATRERLLDPEARGDALFDAMRLGFHPARSADVPFVLQPYWMLGSRTTGTTHGAPHEHDTHVPLLFWGPKWMKPGRVDARVGMVDLAPTLARILGVEAPAQSEGRALD